MTNTHSSVRRSPASSSSPAASAGEVAESSRPEGEPPSALKMRRGVVAVAMLLALVFLQLTVVVAVIAGGRHQDITHMQIESSRAFYGAEAGTNMAIRELMIGVDEDGDGTVGSISNDSNAADNPTLGLGVSFVVTRSLNTADITLQSTAVDGDTIRTVEVVLQ